MSYQISFRNTAKCTPEVVITTCISHISDIWWFMTGAVFAVQKCCWNLAFEIVGKCFTSVELLTKLSY